MAKINIEVDTEAKTLVGTVDGKDIGEISDVSIYRYEEDDVSVHIYLKETEENGVKKAVRIMASEEETVGKIVAALKKEYKR